MFVFKISEAPHSPPHPVTLRRILDARPDPKKEQEITAAAEVLGRQIRSAPMWEHLRHQRAMGAPISDVAALVRATAYDLLIRYSGDVSICVHCAGMFFASLDRAVEDVLSECRLSGLIL